MNHMFLISTEKGALYYSLSYIGALVVGAAIFLYQGYRQKVPIRAMFSLLLILLIFFILGNRLLTSTPGEWKSIITDLRFPDTANKSVLGGIAGLFIGLITAKFLFSFRFPIAGLLAYSIPAGMIIARFGCLMAGCCFGEPADLPWAIQYHSGTMPYDMHLHQGLINISNQFSLPVHPAQLYEMLACVIIIIVLWLTDKTWNHGSSKFLFSVLLYLIFRFIIEFFRVSLPGSFLSDTYLGLKAVQWLLVFAILLILNLIIFKERKKQDLNSEIRSMAFPIWKDFAIITFSLAFLILADHWLSVFEVITLILFVFSALFAFALHLYINQTAPVLRWSFPAIVILSFFLMSQDTVHTANGNSTYSEIKFGTSVGRYYDELAKLLSKTSDGECTYYDHGDYAPHKYTFFTGGAEFSHVMKKDEFKSSRYGIGVFGGIEKETRTTGEYEKVHPIIALHPFCRFDWHYFGFGLGVHFGALRSSMIKTVPDKIEVGEYFGGTSNLIFMPEIQVQMGPFEIICLEASLANHFPSWSPLPMIKGGFATGMGKTDGRKIGAGTWINYYFSENPDDIKFSFYGSFIYPIDEKWLVEVFYGDNFQSGNHGSRVCSLGFHKKIFK